MEKAGVWLTIISMIIASACGYGNLRSDVTHNTNDIARQDSEIATVKETVGGQAVALGRIEQKIDDLRCAETGKGCAGR